MVPERETRPPRVPHRVERTLRAILGDGRYELPDPAVVDGYGGTGAAGKWLEHLLGIEGGNRDQPDAGTWELKTKERGGLITLGCLEHTNGWTLDAILDRWGFARAGGERKFHHTVRGDRWSGGRPSSMISNFRIFVDDDHVVVRHRRVGDVMVWRRDDVVNALAHKVRRLLLVHIERVPSSRQVLCHHASLWWEPMLGKLGELMRQGYLRIDVGFKRRENGTVRNHGTRFRLVHDKLDKLYRRHRVLEQGGLL